MPFLVQLTADAAPDLEDIFHDISQRHSPDDAVDVLARIERAFRSLAEHPQLGIYPRELLDIGIRECREVFFKPYRIIYRVMASNVYVLVVADGRRDMQSLLQRRLLQA